MWNSAISDLACVCLRCQTAMQNNAASDLACVWSALRIRQENGAYLFRNKFYMS